MKKLINLICLAYLAIPLCAANSNDSIVVDTLAKTAVIDTIKAIVPDTAKVIVPIPENKPAENQATDTQLDKIIRKNGEIINATIVRKNLYEVQYRLPGEKIIKKLSTANIKELQYADGKTDLIDNNPEKKTKDWVAPVSEKDWAKVEIAYEEVAVSGMISKGMVETFYEAKKLNTENDVLERSAIVVLKKKAYSLGASAILIRSKDFKREYGELPAVTVKAEAFAKP